MTEISHQVFSVFDIESHQRQKYQFAVMFILSHLQSYLKSGQTYYDKFICRSIGFGNPMKKNILDLPLP